MTTSRFWGVLSVVLLLGGAAALPLHAQKPLPKAVGQIQTSALSSEVVRASQEAVQGPDRSGKDGPMAKIGLELALLYHQQRVEGTQGIRRLREDARQREQKKNEEGDPEKVRSRTLSPISADGRSVMIEATAAEKSAASLLNDLRRLGLEDAHSTGRLVSGRLPISALQGAAKLSTLGGMMPSYARSHVGQVESEADTSHSAYDVRNEMGVDGAGQKICALSDSYNQASGALTAAGQDIETGDLPGENNPLGNTTPVDVLDDTDQEGTDEGRAMLQLIHDIAPGAELGYHTATRGLLAFAEGVRALADPTQGDCDVIVDDIGYNIEPFYQDGPVTNAIDDVVEQHDVVYFSSAGNDGQNAYRAPFRNTGDQGLTSDQAVAHDFNPGAEVDTRQQITISPGGEFGFFTFQWTDPSVVVEGSDGADSDIDVALVDDTLGIVAESLFPNIEDGRPVESLSFENDGSVDTDGDGVADSTFHLVIEKYAGPDPEEVRYVYNGSNYSIDEYDTRGATVYGHPMAERGMAVAAAPFFRTAAYSRFDPAVLESFSSKGGIPILFDQSGNRINAINREKPDVTGTDGIDNTFFGFDIPDTALSGVDPDSHPNFFGTSASAPNVAAIAALIRQSRENYSSEEVYDRLESTAQDVTQRVTRTSQLASVGDGVDPWSGHGFVQAMDAVPPLDIRDLQLVESPPNGGSAELSWQVRSGVTIDQYDFERRYFAGPFEPLNVSVNDETAVLENLGLGVYTFRVKWTRPDGVTGQRTLTDTLGFQSVEAEVTSRDQQGRGAVEVSWGVPNGTEHFDYRVERRLADEEDEPFETVGNTIQTQVEVPRQMPGTYVYRVTGTDGQNNSLSSSTVTLDVELDGPAVAVGPYPNPVEGDAVTVDLTVQNTQRLTVEVYNAIGERMYKAEPRVESLAPEELRLNVRDWASGVYFFRVRGQDFSKTRKLVVVR